MSPSLPASRFRVVQPYGRDRGREATVLSEHSTADEAFAEIDRLAAQMQRTGVRSDFIDVIVVDSAGRVVPRPNTH